MRKNKGFTLIELLAVIVILAIIAVITVPKVAEMIDSSRKGSAEDSFYGVLKTAELAWAKGLQDNQNLGASTCTVSGTTLSCTGTTAAGTSVSFSTSISGSAPTAGTVSLDSNGAATVATGNELVFNGYECSGTTSTVTCTKVSS